ncbi:MAG TPA: hypothetical protein VEW42_00580 [Candidatus Eisenbacteria bacterium]|nr:hypothetical protein [Candidatus Eisenbacteria bacterium]
MSKQYRDRFFLVRLAKDEKNVKVVLLGVTLLLLLLLGNSFYLTVQSLKNSQPILPTGLPLVSRAPTNVSVEPSPTAIPIQKQAVQQGPAVKEYFIAMGAGSSTAADWTDVPGLTAQIDFGNYPSIKEILFEASVGIPTANEDASVRLFNVTDKHPVWYSDVTLTNGQFGASSPFIYDKGVKIYQVQMKTSLQFLASLIQSRIHIILK